MKAGDKVFIPATVTKAVIHQGGPHVHVEGPGGICMWLSEEHVVAAPTAPKAAKAPTAPKAK